MSKLYRDMSPEEKEKHQELTDKYRKENPELYRNAALKYYYTHKEQAAAKAKRWRENNKEYIKTKQREDKRARKLKAIEYLGGICNLCKQAYHPAVFEFHHKDPSTKDRDPSKMLQLSWERLTQELDKCLLLCANCHRLTHHEENYI